MFESGPCFSSLRGVSRHSPDDVSAIRRSLVSSTASIALGIASAFSDQEPALAKCKDIESCREEGERRIAQDELDKGPIVRLPGGIRFREPKRGSGDEVLREGDVAEITFVVTTTGGNYMYSFGRSIEPGQADYGETLRVLLGRHDVPIAVERAMVGMRRGGVRRIEVPPALGFSTSGGEPAPVSFSGRKKMERYEALLTGNGLQPGYEALLIFEVEVVKIKPV